MAYAVQGGQWLAVPITLRAMVPALVMVPLLHQSLERAVPGPYGRAVFPTATAVQVRPVTVVQELLVLPAVPVRPPRAAYLRHGQGEQAAILTPHVEMDLGDGWVDVSEDVISAVKAEWGIRGGGPRDRVAAPGVMQFDLDNSAVNSAGLRGYYSPDHVDAREGFRMGTPARLLLGTTVKWVGTVTRIAPKPGVRDPVSVVECGDWLEDVAREKMSGLPVQVDIQSDDLFKVLVAAAGVPPPGGTRVSTGSDVYPYALDNARDEQSRILTELQKVALSEYGQIYVSAGVAVFEGRRRRGAEGPVLFAMHENDQIIALSVLAHDRDQVINRLQVTIHPRRVDTSDDVALFSLAAPVQILANTTIVIACPYRDPDQRSQRVGGIDMQAPTAAADDYVFNVHKEGDAGDLTDQLTVSATFGGNSAVVTVSNRGPSDGYLPAGGLRLRGRGLYDFEPVISDERDAESVGLYAENVLAYDMPHQGRPSTGQDLARYILHLHAYPTTRAMSVTFVANWDDVVAQQALDLDVSDRISITSPTTGLDSPFFINGVRLNVHQSGLVAVTWGLAPADPTAYWLLGVVGRSELGETTILGYGFLSAAWILQDQYSELGTNTTLN